MEYLKEIAWYLSLLAMLWFTYRFILLNLREFDKIERGDEPSRVRK
jgi:hypothetical protein